MRSHKRHAGKVRTDISHLISYLLTNHSTNIRVCTDMRCPNGQIWKRKWHSQRCAAYQSSFSANPEWARNGGRHYIAETCRCHAAPLPFGSLINAVAFLFNVDEVKLGARDKNEVRKWKGYFRWEARLVSLIFCVHQTRMKRIAVMLVVKYYTFRHIQWIQYSTWNRQNERS